MGGSLRPRAASSLRSRAVALLGLGFASLVALGVFEALDEGRVIAAEREVVAVRQVTSDNQALSAAMTAQQAALKSYVEALAQPDRTPPGLGVREDLLNEYLTASGESRAAQARLSEDASRAGIDASPATGSSAAWESWAAQRRGMAEAGPTDPVNPAVDATGVSLFATFAAEDRIFSDAARGEEAAAAQRATGLNASHARVFYSGLAVEAVALVLLGVAFIRSVLSPLARLTATAAELAEGRAAPVPFQERRDEVGSLARALRSWQRTSAEMYRVFERSPIGIARLSGRGEVLDVNPSLKRMVGDAGRRLTDMVVTEDRPAIAGHIKQLREGVQESAALEARFVGDAGDVFWADVTLAAVPSEDGERYLLAMVEDVELRKRQEFELRHKAGHDALTQLPNRSLFEDRLGQAIRIARRRGSPLSILLLDLDRFKPVNDELGHHAGDEVLRQVARRLRSVLRESDTLARLGGDEFAVVLAGEDRLGADHAAAKLEEAMVQPFSLGAVERSVGVSAGIAVYPGDGADVHSLLASADAGMYRVKRRHHDLAAAGSVTVGQQ